MIEAARRLEFPAARVRAEEPPASVRWGLTVLALIIAVAAGALLYRRSVSALDGARGADLYNSGQPGLAYPYLQRAARASVLHSKPCLDLADMAVWAIDDGFFQHYYRIEDPRTLEKLAFLSYARSLDRQPGASKAWAGMAELFKKERVLRVKEAQVDLDALGGEEPAGFEEEDRLVIAAYRRAIRLEPNNYFYHAYLGDFYDERGFRSEAIEAYGRSIEIMPDLSWHYYLPRSDVPEDLYAAAHDGLERSLQSNPGYPRDRIWANLGDLAQRGRDAAAAEEAYKKAIAAAVDPSVYEWNLGSLYFDQKRYEDAQRHLTGALERDTLLPRVQTLVRVLLGRIAMVRDDPRAAADQFKQARWLSPNASGIALDLGRAYERLGMIDKAEVEYRTAIRLEPGRPFVYTELIDMYRRTRQIGKAIPLAEQLIHMFPDDPIFKEQLRSLYHDLGRPEQG